MVNAEVTADLFRRQIQRILAGTEFAASRQLREYFKFLGEAAIEGRTRLDRTEIAERVLNRGKNFNPVDDASVRKLATLLRQKLAAYHTAEGVDDEVVITLPTDQAERASAGSEFSRCTMSPPAVAEVGPYDQVTVGLTFAPERATQQAGISIRGYNSSSVWKSPGIPASLAARFPTIPCAKAVRQFGFPSGAINRRLRP